MPLLNTAIPTGSADVVAVFDADLNQVFARARPMKVTVKESAKVMEHPVETGSTISDHRVTLPVEIDLSMILISDDYRSTYQQIRQLFLNATLLTVQTRTASYSNMLISDMPHEESPEQFDVIALALSLREVDFVKPKTGKLPPSKVRNKTKADTVNRGVQSGKTFGPEEKKKSFFLQLFDYFKG